MTKKTKLPQIQISSLLGKINPIAKLLFLTLGIGLLIFILYRSRIFSYINPTVLTIAAGDEQGESHIISEAIRKVVEEKDKTLRIRIISTKGTSQNIELLAKGEAQLITAQADVAAKGMDMSPTKNINTSKPENTEVKATPRTVAVLYQDYFQLVVRDTNIKEFGQIRGKVIAVYPKGGQYDSFLKLAEHYGLMKPGTNEPDFITKGKNTYYDDRQAEEDLKNRNADVLFRVRALGNKGIATLIQQYNARLLPIDQGQAMKIKYPTFKAATIPQGAYKGNPPIPEKELNTIVVPRLLLASDKVDQETIQEITKIILENPQSLARAIDELAKEHNKDKKEYDTVKPLTAGIRDPRSLDNEQIPIPLHPGALAFYERDKDFLKENADYLSFIWGIFVVLVPLSLQIKSSWEQNRKDAADEYIGAVIKLMKKDLYKIEERQKKLDEVFKQAADALIQEEISQESFRTFNEAYKTSREALERDRQLTQQQKEQQQTETSAKYIQEVVTLLQDNQETRENLHLHLDEIMKQVANDLVRENISQESFRTFVEAYKTTRDTIDRKI